MHRLPFQMLECVNMLGSYRRSAAEVVGHKNTLLIVSWLYILFIYLFAVFFPAFLPKGTQDKNSCKTIQRA